MQPLKSLWWGGVEWGGVEWGGVEWSESKFSDHSPHARIVGELINLFLFKLRGSPLEAILQKSACHQGWP